MAEERYSKFDIRELGGGSDNWVIRLWSDWDARLDKSIFRSDGEDWATRDQVIRDRMTGDWATRDQVIGGRCDIGYVGIREREAGIRQVDGRWSENEEC